MQSKLAEKILQTIIYYNILGYSLTSFEIWKYLIVADGDATEKDKCSLSDVIEALEGNKLKKYTEKRLGFYFLKECGDLVERRLRNDKNSILKYEIAERVAWWLRFAPFVRMVAVTGSVSMKNCEKGSDIDYLVVIDKGRIWTGRFLVTIVVHAMRRRRHREEMKKNRICLNYYVTSECLEIGRKDLFAANEYTFLYPLLGFSIFKKFCEANAGWIKNFKPNWEIPGLKPAKYFIEYSRTSSSVKKTLEGLINFFGGDRMEAWLKKKQTAHIEKNPLTQKSGAYIEYNDENLIFLPEPQGPDVMEKFRVLTSKYNFL